jgi:hypothetical protein
MLEISETLVGSDCVCPRRLAPQLDSSTVHQWSFHKYGPQTDICIYIVARNVVTFTDEYTCMLWCATASLTFSPPSLSPQRQGNGGKPEQGASIDTGTEQDRIGYLALHGYDAAIKASEEVEYYVWLASSRWVKWLYLLQRYLRFVDILLREGNGMILHHSIKSCFIRI